MSTAERHLLLARVVSEVRRKGVRQIIEKGFKGGRRIIRMELRRRGVGRNIGRCLQFTS